MQKQYETVDQHKVASIYNRNDPTYWVKINNYSDR